MGTPEKNKHWSLITLRERLVKIGARIVRHGLYVVFQLAEVAVRRLVSPESCAGSIACEYSRLRWPDRSGPWTTGAEGSHGQIGQ